MTISPRMSIRPIRGKSDDRRKTSRLRCFCGCCIRRRALPRERSCVHHELCFCYECGASFRRQTRRSAAGVEPIWKVEPSHSHPVNSMAIWLRVELAVRWGPVSVRLSISLMEAWKCFNPRSRLTIALEVWGEIVDSVQAEPAAGKRWCHLYRFHGNPNS
jgi:hypothetical protein